MKKIALKINLVGACLLVSVCANAAGFTQADAKSAVTDYYSDHLFNVDDDDTVSITLQNENSNSFTYLVTVDNCSAPVTVSKPAPHTVSRSGEYSCRPDPTEKTAVGESDCVTEQSIAKDPASGKYVLITGIGPHPDQPLEVGSLTFAIKQQLLLASTRQRNNYNVCISSAVSNGRWIVKSIADGPFSPDVQPSSGGTAQ